MTQQNLQNILNISKQSQQFNEDSEVEEQEQIRERLRMLELEESLILDLIKEMRIRDELLTRFKKEKVKEPKENEESKNLKKKKVNMNNPSNNTPYLQGFPPGGVPYSLMGMPLPYAPQRMQQPNSLVSPSGSFFSKAVVENPSIINPVNSSQQHHTNSSSIIYNSESDGCEYEDQPNRTPLLHTPGYQRLSSSLSHAPNSLPTSLNKLSISMERNTTLSDGEGGGDNNFQCFNCGEKGHMFLNCPHHGLAVSRASCFKCGRVGHLSKNCTYEDNRICFLCGSKGHITRNCPMKKEAEKGGNGDM